MKIKFLMVDGEWHYVDDGGNHCPVTPSVVEAVFNTSANEHYTFVVVNKSVDVDGTGPVTADLRIALRYGMIDRVSITFDQETPFGKGAEVQAFNYEFNEK